MEKIYLLNQGQADESLSGIFNVQHLIGSDGKLGTYLISAITVGVVMDVIYIIYSGFAYIMSRGDDAAVKKAKGGIKYAIIGLIYLMLAFGIVNGFLFILGASTM